MTVSDPDSKKPQAEDGSALSKVTFFASLGILLSRFSGLIRTQVVNAVFGATGALDAFWVAYRFPNALRDLFADGALSSAFTKFYVDARTQGPEAERRLVSTTTAVFGVITLIIAILGVLLAKEIIYGVTDSSFAERGSVEPTIRYFKVLAFYLPLTMLSAIAMAMLGTLRMTFRATIASAFFNLGTIAGALLGAPLATYFGYDAMYGLVFGTMVGGCLQFVYQLIPLLKRNIFPFPMLRISDLWQFSPLRGIALLMLPRAFAQGATILALLVNTHFATQIGEGAMVHVNNAQVLILVPVGLFGVATGFSSLPMLTEAVNKKDANRFSELISSGLYSTLWLALWTMFTFAFAGFPLVVTLFEHGRFLREDSLSTCFALIAYAMGILFNSGTKVLHPVFFSFGYTKQIVYNSFFYLAVNATLSSLLAPKFGLVGLGISYSCASFVDFALNYVAAKRLAKKQLDISQLFHSNSKNFFGKLSAFVVLNFSMGAVGIFVLNRFWFPNIDSLNKFQFYGLLPVLISLTAIVFLSSTWLWGPPQLKDAIVTIKRKFGR